MSRRSLMNVGVVVMTAVLLLNVRVVGAQLPGAGVAGATTQAQVPPEDCFWFCTRVSSPTGETIGWQCNDYGYPVVPAPSHGYTCLAITEGCFTYRGPFCDGMPAAILGVDGTYYAMIPACPLRTIEDGWTARLKEAVFRHQDGLIAYTSGKWEVVL